MQPFENSIQTDRNDASMVDVLTPKTTETEESVDNFLGKLPAFQNMCY